MRNPGCDRCSLSKAAHYVCLWGDGPSPARIMLVGEAPGEQEEKHEKPFVGPAGRLLDRALREAGIRRDHVYITNVVKCRPPLNRTPTKEEHNACMRYLVEECEQVQPEVILCLGASAAKAITGASSLASSRGQKLTTRRELGITIPVYATYHPSAALRDGGEKSRMFAALVDDLRSVCGTQEEVRPTVKHRRALMLPNDDRAALAATRLQGAGLISVDLEWLAGKDEMLWPWNPQAKALSVSVSARIGDEILSLGIGLPMTDNAREKLSELLTRERVIAHNGTADSLWLRGIGLPYRISGDTMLLAHALDEDQKLGLESLAVRYVDGMREWKTPLWHSPPASLDEWEALLRYNTDDTYATLLLWEALTEQARIEDRRVHGKILMPALRALTGAAWRGVPLDRDRLQRATMQTYEARAEHVAKLSELSGMSGTDAAKIATSSQKTQAFLRDRYGLEIEDSARGTLTDVATKSEAVPEILGIRKQQKLLSTYLEPWRDLINRQGDGRLHTIYRIHGTRTGRLSAELERGGSLQVTPREQWVRDMIRAPEGYRIIAADYSQIELRVVAWLAREATMIQLFREGTDLHSATAAFMLASREAGLSLPEFWEQRDQWIARIPKDSEERQSAKGANFGLVYGLQPEGFRVYARRQYGVDLSPEDAERVHSDFFRLYPVLLRWHREAAHNAKQTGYVTTPFGRRRYVGEELTKAINSPVQSTASDLTLLAMGAIDNRIREEQLDAYIIGFVHDSVLLECKEDIAEDVSKMVAAEMSSVDTSPFGFEIDIPLPVDTSIGESWVK